MRKRAHAYLVESPSKTLLAIAITALGASAHADNLPLSLSLSETLSRDNNLYRVEPGQYAIADTVSSTGMTLGLDKSYGRQHYTANLGTALNRYIDSSQLNNTSYDVNLNISSEFADKGLLRLGGGATQKLARFDIANGDVINTNKNIKNTSYLNAQGSYGGYGALNPYVTYTHFQQGFTYTNSNYQTANQNAIGLGTYYALVPQFNIGFGVRGTDGDISYDQTGNNQVLIDHMHRRDIDLTANWVATGLSSLYARLSATKSKDRYEGSNNGQQSSENEGWTGDINWSYTPQGRLSYYFDLSRDTGNTGRGAAGDIYNQPTGTYKPGSQNTENNRLSDTLNAKITWDASYKFKLNAAAYYTRYTLYRTSITTYTDGSVVPVNNPTETSHSSEYSIGGKYQFARWLDLYCDIKRLKRTEDTEYRPYNATVTACTGQFNINGMN